MSHWRSNSLILPSIPGLNSVLPKEKNIYLQKRYNDIDNDAQQ